MDASMQKQMRGGQKSGLIICAWCSRHLGIMKGAKGVSHGICLDCKTRELARWRVRNPLAGGHGTHQGWPLFAEVSMREALGHP